MKPPKEKVEDVQAPIFDPFPEPNTMPSGWDLSGLIPDTRPCSPSPAENSAATTTK